MTRTLRSLSLAVAVCLMAYGQALADSRDFSAVEQQIADLQARIDTAADSGALKPEGAEALQGKQRELVNLEAKLKAEPQPTPDERAALGLALKTQQERLAELTRTAPAAAAKRVDPSALPPTTYVAPNGATIVTPSGGAVDSGGVLVTPNGPAISPSPAATPVVPGNGAR